MSPTILCFFDHLFLFLINNSPIAINLILQFSLTQNKIAIKVDLADKLVLELMIKEAEDNKEFNLENYLILIWIKMIYLI